MGVELSRRKGKRQQHSESKLSIATQNCTRPLLLYRMKHFQDTCCLNICVAAKPCCSNYDLSVLYTWTQRCNIVSCYSLITVGKGCDLMVIIKVQKWLCSSVWQMQGKHTKIQDPQRSKLYNIWSIVKTLFGHFPNKLYTNGAVNLIWTDRLLWFWIAGSALWVLFIHTGTNLLFSSYLSLIWCFWQCYQRYDSIQRYTCSLRKSCTAVSSESCSTTENAPERANTDKSHTFPLWCVRDLKRKALHHRERLCPICLQHFSP